MSISNKKHQAWLKFVRDVVSIPAGLTKQDLIEFRNMAHIHHPVLIDLIDEYLRLAEQSNSDVLRRTRPSNRGKTRKAHLFDLFREKTFFPQNSDLARFASKVVPNMRSYRFDKMSRADIAGRIIEYLEEKDPRTRQALEESMRDALAAIGGRPSKEKEVERRSFLSKWERIIKGVEF